MSQIVCTCQCGNQFAVSEFAVGMDTVCARCGTHFRVSSKNVTRTEVRLAPTNAGGEGAPVRKDVCARCGRGFRGAWDRYETPAGVYCHICANHADTDIRSAIGAIQKGEQVQEAAQSAEPADVGPETFSDRFARFRETREFRIGLWVAALSVIFFAIYFSMTEAGNLPDDQTITTAAAEASQRPISPVMVYVVAILKVAFGFLSFVVALYITLAQVGRLPHDGFLRNLAHVCISGLILFGVSSLISFSIGAFIPLAGMGLSVALLCYIFFHVYDFGLSDLVTFWLIRIVVNIMMWGIKMMVFGTMGISST